MQIKDGIRILLDSATLQEIFNETNADEIKAILKYKIENRKAVKFAQKFSIKEQDEIVAFLCDRKQCEKCSYPMCKHTFDIRHAKNFENKGGEVYAEAEH